MGHVVGAVVVAAFGLDCGQVAEQTSLTLTSAIVSDPEAPAPSASPVLELPPAIRYTSLRGEECVSELVARGVEFARVERIGVDAPVRLFGPLSGVEFVTLMPDRGRTPYEIFDCPLVLALDDFAKQLRDRSVARVIYYSAHRPIVPGVVPRGHEMGLAIDIAYLVRTDGTSMNVLRDFDPLPFDRPCTSPKLRPDANELRRIACDAVEAAIFNVALTPDYDAAHKDHFHFELIPGSTTFIAR